MVLWEDGSLRRLEMIWASREAHGEQPPTSSPRGWTIKDVVLGNCAASLIRGGTGFMEDYLPELDG